MRRVFGSSSVSGRRPNGEDVQVADAGGKFTFLAFLATVHPRRRIGVLRTGPLDAGLSKPTTRRGLIPALVFVGLVVAVLSSLGAPLVPGLASAHHVSLITAQWTLTIALLASAMATPTMGRIGDGPGRRTMILWTGTVAMLAAAGFAEIGRTYRARPVMRRALR